MPRKPYKQLSCDAIIEIRELTIGVVNPDFERIAELAQCDIEDIDDRLIEHDLNVELCEHCEYYCDIADMEDRVCLGCADG